MQSICSFEECSRKRRKLEYCDSHYAQLRAGRALSPLRQLVRGSVRERLDAYTDKSGDCWLWTGGTTNDGYGLTTDGGVRVLAHRAAYELAYGEIHNGLEIDHMCHTPRCVRVDHLQAVTSKENSENRNQEARGGTSGVRGVSWHKRTQKWRAHVRHNGRQHSAGYFHSLDDAKSAAVALRNELFTNNREAG